MLFRSQAARYECSEERQGYRSGHYSRNLTTTSGDVTLNVPRLKGISFETAIIERYRRRESSVEEALIEMYLAGVSVRRVEDITEALWGSKVSPSTISELNKKAYVHIEDWRNRPLQGGRYPYVYVDGIYLLEDGIQALFSSGRYAEYLKILSKLHHYNFGNVLLITMQFPTASRVAGFHTWKNALAAP